jgi:hypothetical protein
MTVRGRFVFACLVLVLAGSVAEAQAQGQSSGKGKAEAPKGNSGQGVGKARAEGGQKASAKASGGGGSNAGASAKARSSGESSGNSAAARGKDVVRARSGGAARGAESDRAAARAWVGRLPTSFGTLDRGRRSDRFVLGAAALAAVHGLRGDGLDLRRADDRLEVRNRRGQILFDLDERRARDLGSWELRLLGDRQPGSNAPAFCRSGEGHPVWGREWCLDRGHGLGRSNDRLWSRTTQVSDIIFLQPMERVRYDRVGLLDVLGEMVFGRLALHALSLGFDQPLAGRWVAEPRAPRLLVIDAGPEPVAELVDLDGNGRVDVLYVTQYGW